MDSTVSNNKYLSLDQNWYDTFPIIEVKLILHIFPLHSIMDNEQITPPYSPISRDPGMELKVTL